jgi:hypothetical protein
MRRYVTCHKRIREIRKFLLEIFPETNWSGDLAENVALTLIWPTINDKMIM